MENTKKTYYYKTYTDDIVESKNQDFKLPNDYKWIHNNIAYKFFSKIGYSILWVIGFIYVKLILKVEIKNRKVLKKYKNTGYFIFGNHTQVLGDIFVPAIGVAPERAYFVCSPSNIGVAGIGRLLPMFGALPIPEDKSKMKLFYNAIRTRIKQSKCVIIYPEAHVWPYYTKIREYPDTAFKFPVNMDAPSFCMTTTYQKRKTCKKPKITVYIDGPFIAKKELPKDEKAKQIHNEIYNCMKNRSAKSNYEFIEYKRG